MKQIITGNAFTQLNFFLFDASLLRTRNIIWDNNGTALGYICH